MREANARTQLDRETRWSVLAGAVIVVLTLWGLNAHGVPVSGPVVPVMALAVVAGTRSTALVAGLAALAALVLTLAYAGPFSLVVTRLVVAWLACVAVVVLAHLRTRHESQFVEQTHQLAETTLSSREGRRLAMALDAANMGVWEWHVDSDALECRRLAPMFGVDDDAQVTSPLWAAAVHPDDRAEWSESSDRALAGRQPWFSVHRVTGADGVTRWLEARGEPVLDATGRAVGMAGTVVDVSLRRCAEQDASDAALLTGRMVDSLATLAQATTEPGVKAAACTIARELFDSDAASFWNAEHDPAVLEYRVPDGLEPDAEARGAAMFGSGGDPAGAQARFITHEPDADTALIAGRAGAPASAVLTPIRIAGKVAAYLALSWQAPRRAPSQAWLAVVDRFAVNVAVALTVVRRQVDQHDAQRLTLRLQNGLLPTRVRIAPPLFTATVYRPGERRLMLGGDFLDLVPHEDGRLSFVVGDVAGHGPEQAALGTILRSAWTGLASSGATDPPHWAQVLNDLLVRRRDDESTFVTAAMGVLDPTRKTLTYVLAGHPPPFQLVPQVSELPMPESPPLGMLTRPIEPVTAELPDGFGLLVFTDGLFDGFDSSGARLGFHGLHALVASRGPLRTSADLAALVAEVERRNGGPLADDVAALLVVHDAARRGLLVEPADGSVATLRQ